MCTSASDQGTEIIGWRFKRPAKVPVCPAPSPRPQAMAPHPGPSTTGQSDADIYLVPFDSHESKMSVLVCLGRRTTGSESATEEQ